MQTDLRLKQQASTAKIVDAIEKISQGKELLIAFDRDGTLVPYAHRPEDAILDPAVRNNLLALATTSSVTVAIVSARSIAQLRGEFDSSQLIIAGNYGLEIHFPDKPQMTNQVALQSARALKEARDELVPLIKPAVNAILEDHGYSLCLHWHTVPVDARPQVHALIKEVSTKFPELLFRAQPTSYEVLPNTEWDKGQALAYIDSTLDPERDRAYVFVGDSAADEPAFAWVNARRGVSVRVGSLGENTCSQYQLTDTLQAAELLPGLVGIFAERQ